MCYNWFFIFGFVSSQVLIGHTSAASCIRLSADVKCGECDGYGRCRKGTVEIDEWLKDALKTQREIQLDIPVDQIQLFDSHNSYNARAYGLGYGANDTCQWPPPYKRVCTGLANHEFSITDQLNMGIRAVSIDNWWCEGRQSGKSAMRVAHLGTPLALGCGDYNVLYEDVIAEIGQWLYKEGNEEEFVKITLDEKFRQFHDNEVNGPLERYLGHDTILSPADLRTTYGGVWPALRRMREDGKRVVVVSSEETTHQGKYIHVKRCDSGPVNKFTNYPQCGNKTETGCRRVRGDATHYVFEKVYDGPNNNGVIEDLTELVKCRVNFPATDMATPQLMRTGVFTWAYGESFRKLNENPCVMLNTSDYRWYTSSKCEQSLSYACQSLKDPNDWLVSELTGPYDVTQEVCPMGYKFSLPQNGFRQQKLKEEMRDGVSSVWINYNIMQPWNINLYPSSFDGTGNSLHDQRTSSIVMPCFFFVFLSILFHI